MIRKRLQDDPDVLVQWYANGTMPEGWRTVYRIDQPEGLDRHVEEDPREEER